MTVSAPAAPGRPNGADGVPPSARGGRSLVAKLVDRLGEMSLAVQEGDYLGSEDVLLTALGVSRPTLRQAAKVVEADRLIEVRRGLRGGYYATRPDAAHAIRAPARYLRLHEAKLADMHQVSKILFPEAAALAAACADPAPRVELEALAAELGARDGAGESVAAMIDADTRLDELLARMTGNPVIVLLNQVAYAFGALERDLKLYRDPADRDRARALQRRLARALIERDPEQARRMALLRSEMIDGLITAA